MKMWIETVHCRMDFGNLLLFVSRIGHSLGADAISRALVSRTDVQSAAAF